MAWHKNREWKRDSEREKEREKKLPQIASLANRLQEYGVYVGRGGRRLQENEHKVMYFYIMYCSVLDGDLFGFFPLVRNLIKNSISFHSFHWRFSSISKLHFFTHSRFETAHCRIHIRTVYTHTELWQSDE